MAGQPSDDPAASEQPPTGSLATVSSDVAVPDPAAPRANGGEPLPVRDPAAPRPPEPDGHTETAQMPNSAGLDPPEELQQTQVHRSSEEAPPAAPQSEATDEAMSIPEDTGDGAVSLDGDPAAETTFLVPVLSVDGPVSTPEAPTPDVADAPLDLTPRSAPPPAIAQRELEPSQERGRASSAMGGVSVPTQPSASPGFRPYSETPVYSDPSPPPPEQPETPPRDQPCSGDWHNKTVDDIIAMDVPDVRIPRCVNTWGACEIRGWLRGLGLEQYAEAMLNNGICGRRLCLLTASNLPRIGITDWQHIRAITASVRSLLSVDDYVPYERQWERPPPGPMTRALYLQCARPTGPPPPSSDRYRQFLRQHGFLDVLLELTNRPVVELPQPQRQTLYREIAVPPVPSPTGNSASEQSQSGSPAPMSRNESPSPRPPQSVSSVLYHRL